MLFCLVRTEGCRAAADMQRVAQLGMALRAIDWRMRGTFRLFILVMTLAFCLAGCGEADKQSSVVMVFAAASTAHVLEPVLDGYAQDRGIQIRVNSASSATLAKQIQQGADAHIYLSANRHWVEVLEDEQLVVTQGHGLLGNRLVLVVPVASSIAEPMGLTANINATDGRFAIADPDTVPAGIYAKQALLQSGVWDAIEPRLIPAKDARAALRLVERGEVAMGVVYATDAVSSEGVRVVCEIDAALHETIHYPLVLLRDEAAARALVQWLVSGGGREAFEAVGFEWVGRADG